jgi:hypothetical protein
MHHLPQSTAKTDALPDFSGLLAPSSIEVPKLPLREASVHGASTVRSRYGRG